MTSDTSQSRALPSILSAGFRPGAAPRRRLSPFQAVLAAVAALVSAFALLPLGFVIWIAVRTGWRQIVALVVRPRVGELLVDTVLLIASTLPPTIVLALALAWCTERTDIRAPRVWSWLASAPLAVPAFVHGYAWISVAPRMNGLPAAAFLSTLAYFPFLYLPVAA